MTGYLPGQKGAKTFTATHTMDPTERVKALEDIGWTIPKPHAKDTGQAVKELKKKITSETTKGGIKEKLMGTGLGKRWAESKPRELLLRKRIMEERAQRALAEQGLTSLPGAVKGYAVGKGGDPAALTRLQQLKANLVAPGLALGVGLPAASLVGTGLEAAETGDPRRAAQDVIDTAGFSAFTGLPILPALAVGQGLSAGAGLLLNRGKQPQQQQEPRLPTGQRVRISQGAGDFMAQNLARVPR